MTAISIVFVMMMLNLSALCWVYITGIIEIDFITFMSFLVFFCLLALFCFPLNSMINKKP